MTANQTANPDAMLDSLFDPRVRPLIDALSDDQVADVLRLMCREWTPDEDPEDLVAGGPENNRGLLFEAAGMNVAHGGDDELASFTAMIARVTGAQPA